MRPGRRAFCGRGWLPSYTNAVRLCDECVTAVSAVTLRLNTLSEHGNQRERLGLDKLCTWDE